MGSFHARFEHPAFSPDLISMPADDTFKAFNFDLCRALDMTSLSVVLDRMVSHGTLDKRLAELFHSQAATLLALMVSENNRMIAITRNSPKEPRP